MLIQIENQLDKQAQYSYLSSQVNAGTNVFPVKNISNFQPAWAVQIGATGEEQSEIRVLSAGAISGTTLTTTANLSYSHPQNVPVYNVHYDKYIVLRSITGTAGTATPLTNGTISITPDSLYTDFDDPTGITSYAYRVQYYNSSNGDTSIESDWFSPGGPSFYSKQKLRDRVREGMYNTEYIKKDDIIDDWMNEWLEEMNTAAVKVNQDYLLGTTSVSFGTAGLGTITVDDYMKARKFEVTYDGVTYGTASRININEYDDNTVFGGAIPRYSWQGDTVFQVLAKGTGGTARITYSKGEALLDEETDELPYPMRKYTRGFIYYARSIAYEKDEKESLSKINYEKALKVKQEFINEITPRDQTGVQHIQYVEALSGSDEVEEGFY